MDAHNAASDMSNLESITIIPILSLDPSTPPPEAKTIKAKVALVYPYSSSSQSAGLLVADPDFRLRRKGGQVHIQLEGAAAKTAGASGIGIGDTLYVDLAGATWIQDANATKTPGRSIGAALLFARQMRLQFSHNGIDFVSINIDESDLETRALDITPPPSPNTHSSVTPATLSMRSNTWSSPAFFRTKPGTERLVLGPDLYPLADDDISFEERPSKRTRYWGPSGDWTFDRQSPSPRSMKSASRLPQPLPSPSREDREPVVVRMKSDSSIQNQETAVTEMTDTGSGPISNSLPSDNEMVHDASQDISDLPSPQKIVTTPQVETKSSREQQNLDIDNPVATEIHELLSQPHINNFQTNTTSVTGSPEPLSTLGTLQKNHDCSAVVPTEDATREATSHTLSQDIYITKDTPPPLALIDTSITDDQASPTVRHSPDPVSPLLRPIDSALLPPVSPFRSSARAIDHNERPTLQNLDQSPDRPPSPSPSQMIIGNFEYNNSLNQNEDFLNPNEISELQSTMQYTIDSEPFPAIAGPEPGDEPYQSHELEPTTFLQNETLGAASNLGNGHGLIDDMELDKIAHDAVISSSFLSSNLLSNENRDENSVSNEATSADLNPVSGGIKAAAGNEAEIVEIHEALHRADIVRTSSMGQSPQPFVSQPVDAFESKSIEVESLMSTTQPLSTTITPQTDSPLVSQTVTVEPTDHEHVSVVHEQSHDVDDIPAAQHLAEDLQFVAPQNPEHNKSLPTSRDTIQRNGPWEPDSGQRIFHPEHAADIVSYVSHPEEDNVSTLSTQTNPEDLSRLQSSGDLGLDISEHGGSTASYALQGQNFTETSTPLSTEAMVNIATQPAPSISLTDSAEPSIPRPIEAITYMPSEQSYTENSEYALDSFGSAAFQIIPDDIDDLQGMLPTASEYSAFQTGSQLLEHSDSSRMVNQAEQSEGRDLAETVQTMPDAELIVDTIRNVTSPYTSAGSVRSIASGTRDLSLLGESLGSSYAWEPESVDSAAELHRVRHEDEVPLLRGSIPSSETTGTYGSTLEENEQANAPALAQTNKTVEQLLNIHESPREGQGFITSESVPSLQHTPIPNDNEELHSQMLPNSMESTVAQPRTRRRSLRLNKSISTHELSPQPLMRTEAILEQDEHPKVAREAANQQPSELIAEQIHNQDDMYPPQETTMRRRTSARLRKSDVPEVLSGWFETRRSTGKQKANEVGQEIDVDVAASLTPIAHQAIKNSETEHDAGGERDKMMEADMTDPKEAIHGNAANSTGKVHADTDASTELVAGLQTPLSFYHPLKSLVNYLNNPNPTSESTIDVLAVVTWQSKKPHRAKAGPKDFYTVLHVMEPSKTQSETEVHVFRPNKDYLPIADKGDAILLRNFQIKSRKRDCYLLSGESSAWHVWRFSQLDKSLKQNSKALWAKEKGNTDMQPLEDTRGAPVELGPEEQKHAQALRIWWENLRSENAN